MNAIEWLRSKATTTVETMVINAADAAASDTTPGTYTITRKYFRGTLPTRMAYEARALAKTLTVTDTVVETLRIGGQYRSQFGQCEYWYTTYEFMGA